MLARHSRGRLPTGLGPEQIALPLGHLVEGRRLELPPVDADVPIQGVISPSGLLDGADTLAEAADRAREFADWIRALADAGYELDGPFSDNCAVYSMRRRPILQRPDSGPGRGPV